MESSPWVNIERAEGWGEAGTGAGGCSTPLSTHKAFSPLFPRRNCREQGDLGSLPGQHWPLPHLGCCQALKFPLNPSPALLPLFRVTQTAICNLQNDLLNTRRAKDAEDGPDLPPEPLSAAPARRNLSHGFPELNRTRKAGKLPGQTKGVGSSTGPYQKLSAAKCNPILSSSLSKLLGGGAGMGWRSETALSWYEITTETQIIQQENPHCCKK